MPGLLVILSFAGLSADPALALDDALSVKLESQSNAGQSGSATRFQEGDRTRVAIEILNAQMAVAQKCPTPIRPRLEMTRTRPVRA